MKSFIRKLALSAADSRMISRQQRLTKEAARKSSGSKKRRIFSSISAGNCRSPNTGCQLYVGATRASAMMQISAESRSIRKFFWVRSCCPEEGGFEGREEFHSHGDAKTILRRTRGSCLRWTSDTTSKNCFDRFLSELWALHHACKRKANKGMLKMNEAINLRSCLKQDETSTLHKIYAKEEKRNNDVSIRLATDLDSRRLYVDRDEHTSFMA